MTTGCRLRSAGMGCIVLMAAMVCSAPTGAAAQDSDRPSPVLDIVKRVASDPTTYVPAALAYEAHHLDWKSSQVFFQHGFLEHNGEFTLSGRADDTPVSDGAGNCTIVAGGFAVLGTSMVHNVSGALIERLLVERYPGHRSLLRRLGWIERVAFASYLSYLQSADHLRQWRRNERLARQLGYQ
ncbi:MAG: hypothetical protein ABI868_08145 [Acidobacteriota bacterium]